ncbi:hypothetical protein [Bradyrhizobium betae]|uniref:Uncharacterized protein n=1 Tax=Bradyrhizobium betae TaxID=244734 RepID=A0A5P6PB70_9BRAD|nr:hypothetical protein [Bradyrhizobium betae]MCS3726484.1 hypothetical protein [Bradyrhizobium betae]QFI75515.1 hypothetical protein F8237_25845 [Bradyrhizobium betae]
MSLALASSPVSSQEAETRILGIHLAMSPELSLYDQRINQKILDALLLYARRSPDVVPCEVHQPYQIDYVFGDFAVAARHSSPVTLVKCLGGVVRYVLQEDITEVAFLAARASEARMAREYSKLDAKIPQRADEVAERMALLSIYRKHSPLHQLLAVDANAISALSFDEFSRWLERNRKAGRFTFRGSKKLLEALDLPVPDPMVLQPISSLASARMPAGVLVVDSEPAGIAALIALFLEHDETLSIDEKAKRRFARNRDDPSKLGDGYDTIARASCRTYDHFGDIWFTMPLRKAESASYSDFCRQVLELSRDNDIATVVRFSPDGSKGLYALLPPACKASD